MLLKTFLAASTLLISLTAAAQPFCDIPEALVQRIQAQLASVVNQANGSALSPAREWSAVVDRQGRLCSAISLADAQPYARGMAIAKAGTANGFSNSAFAASTANLYSLTQPGGIMYGFNSTNPFNPEFMAQGSGIGRVTGGVVTTAGGVPLYQNGQVIGGLGVAGDTACADHVIAYRMRRAAGLDHIPYGAGYNGTDNIDYLTPGQAPNGYKHPHCSPGDIAPSQI